MKKVRIQVVIISVCATTIIVLVILLLNSPKEVYEGADLDYTIKGEYITCIDNIIPNINVHQPILLMMYSQYDCNSCIELGFRIIDIFNSFPTISCFVVTTKNISEKENTNYGYSGNIFKDEKAKLRREVKYFPTPLLILATKDRCIIECLHIMVGANGSKEIETIEQALKTL
jgi:hypothetical protein